jgi:glycosyltransferase involved in cell wall biosynthesis
VIDISVVSGTYNRLRYVQQMVASARASILPCLSHEIVLVDGGSTDGTIQWARQQPDIVLIEQGELLGAVKAFNAGFQAARGEACLAANDDIVFQTWAITRAWVHLADFPEVGQACFYQKRGQRQYWHIEEMMANDGPRHISVPYGQVALVPKELGDRVGWWGDVTRTYGGDNELSANIWEAGYQVEGVEGARIVDQMPDDELRKVNQGNPFEMARRNQPHPDSVLWYKKWPRGPRISHKPKWGLRPLGPLRILYAPIIENQFPVQVAQKHGLRDALGGLGRTVEYNYQLRAKELGTDGMRAELYELASAWQPHLILLQVHSPQLLDGDAIWELREAAPKAQIVNWNGDYHPEQMIDAKARDFMRLMDCQCVVCADWIPEIVALGVPAAYWQIGYEPEGVGVEPNGNTPCHDVLLLANCYSQERVNLANALLGNGWDVGIYGMGWPFNLANGENLYDFRLGCQLYRNAKVAVGDQQWPSAAGYVSNRLFQALAAGGAVFCQQRFAGMEEWLGLVEDEHLLGWADYGELREKIGWALSHPREAETIAKRGQEYVLEHHSFGARVRELGEVILEGRRMA